MDDGSDHYADYPDESGSGGRGPEPRWSRWLWNIIGIIWICFMLTWFLDGCPNSKYDDEEQANAEGVYLDQANSVNAVHVVYGPTPSVLNEGRGGP